MNGRRHHIERKAKYYPRYITPPAALGDFIFLEMCFALPLERPFKEASATEILISRSYLRREWNSRQIHTLVNS